MHITLHKARLPVASSPSGTPRCIVRARCYVAKFSAIQRVAGGGFSLATALTVLLGQPAFVEARVIPPSQLEQSRAQEQELLDIIKQRSGKDFADLEVNSSPEMKSDARTDPEKAAPFKLDSSIKVDRIELGDSSAPLPTLSLNPASSQTLEVDGNTVSQAPPAAAPAVSPREAINVDTAASTDPALVSNAAAESNNAVILGVLALVAVVGVGALGTQQQSEEQATSLAATPGPTAASAAVNPAPAGDAASGVPPNVAEARAWIAKWKAKQHK